MIAKQESVGQERLGKEEESGGKAWIFLGVGNRRERKGDLKIVRALGRRIPGEQGPLSQLSKAYIGSQRLK